MRPHVMGTPSLFRRPAMVLIAAAFCLATAYALPMPERIAPRIAWVCSLVAMALCMATWHSPPRSESLRLKPKRHEIQRILHEVALYLGVTAGLILIVLLTMRSVYVGIDLVHGYPWQGAHRFGFDQAGIRTIAVLLAACVIALLETRDGRLITIQWWLLVLFTMWVCLLSSPFQATKTGGFERTDTTLILVECLSGLTLMAVLMVGWLVDSKFLKPRTGDISGTLSMSDSCQLPNGFRASVAIVALALNVAVLFHILVPAGQSTPALRFSGVRAGVAALVASSGGLFLLRRTWGAQLADATLGLIALGVCGIAIAAIPSERMPLDLKYPMIFNAITVGYAFTAGAFAQLSWVWCGASLPPASTRKRIVPHLNRFAFFCAAVALLSGVMMSFWPGVPGVATMDHSLGRVVAGFAAFLFLMLITLRSARLFERLSFHFLTVAVAACMVAFLATRALPFLSDLPR